MSEIVAYFLPAPVIGVPAQVRVSNTDFQGIHVQKNISSHNFP